MTHADADVAQHRRIREIALPARDRQLVREETQQRVRQPEIAFGVLEVDRIDLVRHRRGADFAGEHALPEVAERDVAPHVAAQIDQHRVDARERIEVLGHPVVRLDLRGVWIPGETQRFDEALAEAQPVDLRIGDQVRIEVADRAVDLAGDRDGGEARALLVQSIGEVRDFLAERRRRRRLTMRARHHRRRRMGVRERAQARRSARRAAAAAPDRALPSASARS